MRCDFAVALAKADARPEPRDTSLRTVRRAGQLRIGRQGLLVTTLPRGVDLAHKPDTQQTKCGRPEGTRSDGFAHTLCGNGADHAANEECKGLHEKPSGQLVFRGSQRLRIKHGETLSSHESFRYRLPRRTRDQP